jgi:hypothetical protein
VKPDRPALASALTLELALEALAALLTAFRRVFRLIRIPPDQKVLQTRSNGPLHLNGAVHYLKFDWNPLNIVSHAHFRCDELRIRASSMSALSSYNTKLSDVRARYSRKSLVALS